MFIEVFLFTKSKSETHSRKHIRRNAFEFLILSTKIQTKGLRKSYSPENHHKILNFRQRKPPKLPWFCNKDSISETGTSIFCAMFSFIPMVFFNLVSYIRSFILLLFLSRALPNACKLHSSPKVEFRVIKPKAGLTFCFFQTCFTSYQDYL